MKVYVFTAESASQGESFETHVQVFNDRAKALSTLKEWRDDCMMYVKKDGLSVNEDEPEFFMASIFGDYCNNHYEFRVTEHYV